VAAGLKGAQIHLLAFMVHSLPPGDCRRRLQRAILGTAGSADKSFVAEASRKFLPVPTKGSPVFDWDSNNLRKIRVHRIKAEEVEKALSNGPILIYEQDVEREVRYVY